VVVVVVGEEGEGKQTVEAGSRWKERREDEEEDRERDRGEAPATARNQWEGATGLGRWAGDGRRSAGRGAESAERRAGADDYCYRGRGRAARGDRGHTRLVVAVEASGRGSGSGGGSGNGL
jgi:hypothetical protein